MSKQNKQPLLQRPAVVGVLASLLSIVVGLCWALYCWSC